MRGQTDTHCCRLNVLNARCQRRHPLCLREAPPHTVATSKIANAKYGDIPEALRCKRVELTIRLSPRAVCGPVSIIEVPVYTSNTLNAFGVCDGLVPLRRIFKGGKSTLSLPGFQSLSVLPTPVCVSFILPLLSHMQKQMVMLFLSRASLDLHCRF